MIEVTEKYFPALALTDAMRDRIEVVHLDGSEFLKNAEGVKFDAILVDCSDISADDTLSCSLFNNDFYRKVISALKPGASFT